MNEKGIDQKQFFNHYHFNTFNKGKRVYAWVEIYDWQKSGYRRERHEGFIVNKKPYSVTVQWKNIGRLGILTAKEAVERLSHVYEPNDILKEIL